MRKIIYSNITKLLAATVFVACTVLACLSGAEAIVKFFKEKEIFYGFEDDYTKTNLRYLLHEPESMLYNTVKQYYEKEQNENSRLAENTILLTAEPILRPSLEEELKYNYDNLYCRDKIDYFVSWNGAVFTNCKASDARELAEGNFYVYTECYSPENIIRLSSDNVSHGGHYAEDIYSYADTKGFVVAAALKKDYEQEVKTAWQRQADIAENTFFTLLTLAVLALVMLVYLISVCGVKRDKSECRMWLDNIWIELQLAAIGFSCLGTALLFSVFIEAYRYNAFPQNMLYCTVGVVGTLAAVIFITSFLSVVRSIKQKSFVKRSLLLSVAAWLLKWLKKLIKYFFSAVKKGFVTLSAMLSDKTCLILVTLLFVYTALIGICGILTPESGFFLFLGVVLFLLGAVFAAYRAKDLEQIKKGTREVKNGNISHKIPPLKSTDMAVLAEDINGIAQGMEKALAARLRAEKMKTELITNVSHDLKTPVTSIINYACLALDVENLPEQARDYITVIAKKGERLKNLTNDIFDISKAQSGNESVFFERLDAGLLINQALAEHEAEISTSEIPFCVNTSQGLYIQADGRKLSRVCSNLIDNILKYSLKGTRAFVSCFERDGRVVMEFKNTASYHMTFDENEILSRFVRGDESRTTEGSGLGLAIAKSYSELCLGSFTVVTDGDLFKAIIEFPKYE